MISSSTPLFIIGQRKVTAGTQCDRYNYRYYYHHHYYYHYDLYHSRALYNESYAYVYRISYMYYVVIGFMTTVVVALAASLLFESDVDHLDPRLFYSSVSRVLENRAKVSHKKYSTSSKTVTFSIES